MFYEAVIYQLAEIKFKRKIILNPLTRTEIETEIIPRTGIELERQLKCVNKIRA